MKKWSVVIAAIFIHLFLGTVYAWSFFQSPITAFTGWSNAQVAWAFSLSVFMLGLAAAWGGVKLPQYGARKLAIVGGVLYAVGYLLSGLGLQYHQLWLLYIGFGFFGGTGIGLAYVTPVATVSRWFSRHQGLATGMVVMGFGFGALLMSKILAPILLSATGENLSKTFLYTGLVFLILIPGFAWFLIEPERRSESPVILKMAHFKQYVFARPFLVFWMMFLINITAGMVFIAFQSPLLQDLLIRRTPAPSRFSGAEGVAALAASGATLIAVSSIFNGAGRFVWAALSDQIGRLTTFRILLLVQSLVFAVLLVVESPVLFSVFVCVILLCYGGGFGLMPSFIRDTYGVALMPVMYGSILTAWSAGGILGPQLVAYMTDHHPDHAGFLVYIVSGSLLLMGFGLSFLYKSGKIRE